MPIEIERDDVRMLVEDGAQLVEVRPAEEYEAEHLPGAINIPLKELDAGTMSRLARDQRVIVYCSDYQ
ncbi:MAG: rhodanese-like domain-containing protein [Dehalococcoidia bacterium]